MGGCTGSSASTLVKMPHCWKSPVAAQYYVIFFIDQLLQERQPVWFGVF